MTSSLFKARNFVGIVAVVALLAGLWLPAASADPVADELAERRQRMSQVREAGGELSGVDDTGYQEAGCVTDATGDTFNLFTEQPENFPRADIVDYCMDYASALRLDLRTVDPRNPLTDPNWYNGFTFAAWWLDTNADGEPDFDVLYVADSTGIYWVLFRWGGEQPECTGDAAFDGVRYIAPGVPSSCFGAPGSVRTIGFMVYDSQWDDPNAPVYGDVAPNTTWSEPVAATATSPPPAPPPPPPPPPPPSGSRLTTRLGGADRYATAVEISRYQFPNGASEVYLARADAFPDALAAGSLSRGPVLLVPSCGALPDVVADEIRRLNPSRVVALGGTAAVCDEILSQAASA